MPIIIYSNPDDIEKRKLKERLEQRKFYRDLAYNPNQPREPKGSATGGEWTGKASRDITQSSEFKTWFRKSKVVDKNGNPLIVYHGTNKLDIETFDTETPNPLTGESGAYFTPEKEYAYHYGDKVYSAYINLQNPYIGKSKPMEEGERFGHFTIKAKQQTIAKGYDGIITIINGKIEEVVAFYPSQVWIIK
jgi:hypothetical protein